MQLLAKQLCSWGGYIISAVFKIQGSENPKMHRMISEWPWKLYSQKYPACTNYSPPRSKFWPLSLHDKLFLRYKVVENWKNGKCTKLPQNELEHLTIKSNLYTLVTPKAQILVFFTIRPPIFKVQGCRKSEKSQMHRMTSEWLWTLNSQNYHVFKLAFAYKAQILTSRPWKLYGLKYPVYTKDLPLWPKFWSSLLCDQPFTRYKVVKNRKNWKCIKWPQTDLEHLTMLTVKSTVPYIQ